MESKLCTGPWLTWEFSILFHAQVVSGRSGKEVPEEERILAHSFVGYATPGRSLSVHSWAVKWSGGFMPITLVLLVSKHFHGENGHAGMPRTNDLQLLRMFWIFKQEWYLGWISVWLLLLLEFLLYFKKANSYLFLWGISCGSCVFVGKFIMREV